MAEFDWNQFQPEDKGFDWEQFAQDPATASPQSSVSEADALARGGAQGSTLGFRDELAGALKSPVGAAKTALEFLGADYGSDEDAQKYKAERDESRALDAAAQSAHPGLYTTGQIGGGVALPVVAAAALPASVTTAAGGLLGALGLGAAAGAGSSDDSSGLGLLKDTATGAGIGGVSYGAGQLLQAGAQKLGNALSSGAASAQNAVRNTAGNLASTAATGKADQELGRELLDSGLVRFGDSARNISSRVGDAVQGARGSAAGVLSDLESKGMQGVIAADALRAGRAIPGGLFPEAAESYGAQQALADHLKPVATSAARQAARAKSGLNVKDLATYGAGALTAGPIGGVAGPLLRRTVGDRAASTGAAVLDKGAKMLLDPETVGQIAPRMGQYGKILLDAANRSGAALNATHFLLGKTDPGYREALKQAQGEGE